MKRICAIVLLCAVSLAHGSYVYDGITIFDGVHGLMNYGGWRGVSDAATPVVLTTNLNFVTTWAVTNGQSIAIPYTSTGYDGTSEWYNAAGTLYSSKLFEDGDLMSNLTTAFIADGTFTNEISGTFPRFYANNAGDATNYLLGVHNVGNTSFGTDQGESFYGCANLTNFTYGDTDIDGQTDYTSYLRDTGITAWDVSSLSITGVTTFANCLNGVTLTTDSYNSLLSNFANGVHLDSVSFHGGTSMFTDWESHDSLVYGDLWSITDGGYTNLEYVTNGTFTTDSGWDKGTGWETTNGYASVTGGNDGQVLSQTIAATPTELYIRYTYTVTDTTNTDVTLALGDDLRTATAASTNVGYAYVATSQDTIGITAEVQNGGDVYATVDDVSILAVDPSDIPVGTNLFANGDFSTTNSWVISPEVTITNGSCEFVSAVNNHGIYQELTDPAGRTFLFTYTVSALSSGTVKIWVGDAGIIRSSTGTYQEIIVGGTINDLYGIFADTTTTATIDNVSVQEVTEYE